MCVFVLHIHNIILDIFRERERDGDRMSETDRERERLGRTVCVRERERVACLLFVLRFVLAV